jgi:hypothetical protein
MKKILSPEHHRLIPSSKATTGDSGGLGSILNYQEQSKI